MGRPPIAPEIHEASGAYAKNPQRRPKDMPKFIPGAPEMPPCVEADVEAAWYWNWICEILDEAGVLTTSCFPLLTIHVAKWPQILHLVELTKDGNVVSHGAKGKSISPEAAMLNQLYALFLKELNEFGLTPASKAKVTSSGGKKDEDPFAAMLTRRMRPTPN